jgi:hypothetical protein
MTTRLGWEEGGVAKKTCFTRVGYYIPYLLLVLYNVEIFKKKIIFPNDFPNKK